MSSKSNIKEISMIKEEKKEGKQPIPIFIGAPSWVLILVAIIGALGAIIAAIITILSVSTIEIYIADIDTKDYIYGEVFIDASENGQPIYPDKPAVIRVNWRNRLLRVESNGYKSKVIPISKNSDKQIVELESYSTSIPNLIPLDLSNRHPWQPTSLTVTNGAEVNEIIINSSGRLLDSDGINFTGYTILRGATLVLQFSNIDETIYDQNRMFKLGTSSGRAFESSNTILLNGEYVPRMNTNIEFNIPEDFDGQLDFVFYQADINNLIVTAYYAR